MLKKLVSGCQTGADLGGLKAAKELGLETGGWMPNGCLTEDGPKPEWLQEYNLQEHPRKGSKASAYVSRTYANVKDSDGTIRFAAKFGSPGEICTQKAISQYKRPSIDIDVKEPRPHMEVVEWIRENNIEVLNVAGNRESTWKGMEEFVIMYLKEVIRLLEQ